MLFNARQAARQRRWLVAAHYLGSALADRGDTPLIWVEYGHALKEAGALLEAVRAYRKVLLLMPDHYDIGDHLAHNGCRLLNTFPGARRGFKIVSRWTR